MKKLALIAVSLMSLSFAACGGGDSATDSFDDFVAANNRVIDAVCACDTDPATCKSENSNTPTEISCLRDVVSANEDAVSDFIACQAAATDDAADCFGGASCMDATAQEACFDAYDAAAEACGELPATINDMFEACFPG